MTLLPVSKAEDTMDNLALLRGEILPNHRNREERKRQKNTEIKK